MYIELFYTDLQGRSIRVRDSYHTLSHFFELTERFGMAWLLEYTEDGVECSIEESHWGQESNMIETVLEECRGKLGVWNDIKLQYDGSDGDVEDFYTRLPAVLADTSGKENDSQPSTP